MATGITLGILTALFQAFAYLFLRKSLAEFPESVTFFLNAVTGVLLWIPFALLTNGVWADVWWVLPFALLSAILSEALVVFALARGDTIISGVLFSTYPVFTIVIAYILLNEHMTWWAGLAITLVVVGTLVVSAPGKSEWRKGAAQSWKFHLIAWPLVAALATGFADVAGKYAIDGASAGTFLIALAIAELPVSLIFLKIQKQSLSQFRTFWSQFNTYKYAFFSGLLSTITLITFWLTFERLPASVASPLTGVTPIFVFVFGILMFKDKVSVKNTIGLTIVIAGVLFLSVVGA